MYKSIAAALVATAATLGAGAAHAGNVSWSIGIATPLVGTVISNARVYAPVPVYVSGSAYDPEPVYVQGPPVYLSAPVPVYRSPAPGVYYPRNSAYYRPEPWLYAREYEERGWGRHWHRRDHHHDQRGDAWGGHDDRGDRREWRHD